MGPGLTCFNCHHFFQAKAVVKNMMQDSLEFFTLDSVDDYCHGLEVAQMWFWGKQMKTADGWKMGDILWYLFSLMLGDVQVQD